MASATKPDKKPDSKPDKKAARKGRGAGPDAPEAAPRTARRQKVGLLDRVTSLVVVMFLVSCVVQYVVAA